MSSSATESHTYTSENHGSDVVGGFQRLWQNQLMCDTQLVTQGQIFHVHRCYLASCSEYFYSMFTKDFREFQQSEIELNGVTAPGLKALLSFAYTGKERKNNKQDAL